MGILQSVLKYWSSEPDEDEYPISLYNNGYRISKYGPNHSAAASPHHKWQEGNKFINQNRLQNENRTGKHRGCAIKCNVANAEGIRWIKHYTSSHRILVVGDGNFSFSTCLAAAFGLAFNMIATSLDSHAFLVKNYHKAFSNLRELSIRGCKVIHEIDATKMCTHPYLVGIKFDRVVFNFPFAGFFKNISRDSQLQRHRKLVSQFLMNAKEMITETGEIHITHKTSEFQMEWKVESMAYSHGLRLVEAVDFNHLDYPGYNTKYGFGGDKNFNCYPSKTYKFGRKQTPTVMVHLI